ncbi:type ISP restriction/modification enzyme [Corynebacterium antarcticum]|uniref:type ISP restriction/modification enzyme n=1 Tax=Corynebacterium antarcticum TaxID=2800405 RepID=UPI002B1EF312|nr:type ISP restriction/modification enzyme [Corynebacterium antarcticum]
MYSTGLATSRDTWCYAFNIGTLKRNVKTLIDTFKSAMQTFWSQKEVAMQTPNRDDVIDFLKENKQFQDVRIISWGTDLHDSLRRRNEIRYSKSFLRISLYRPFSKTHCCFDRKLNNRVYQLPKMFPTAGHDNVGIVLTAPASHFDFTPLATNLLPNLHTLDTGQFFPRWTWEPVEVPAGTLDFGSATTSEANPGTEGEILDGYRRVDNITDEILSIFRNALGGDISKDDIFYFVYGQLHDPNYREAYAADLKKMLPHVETPSSRERFDQLTEAGRTLTDLHVNYEDVDPYPVNVQVKKSADPDDRETWRVTKMKWAKKKDPETGKNVNDTTTIIYNPKVTVTGIPEEAERYLLGSRSALGWIIDRYQVKKDKSSGTVNDPNDWCDEVDNPRYIVDLIAKVTRVAVETARITDSLR